MKTINDTVFGTLEFDFTWFKEEKIYLFDEEIVVLLRVDGNDENESIFEEQRAAYRDFRLHENDISEQILISLFDYYKKIYSDLVAQFGESSNELAPSIVKPIEIAKLVNLTTLVFPLVFEEGEKSFGIMGSCTWDIEHGIAVKYTDGEIEIGGQDLLT